ncbi:S-adenosyl-L-methionine-dependent methyltransferase [Coniochaeta sp. 2T2.1]|nr:S-adenosyl-L-methionine-dependent methyltransferase [Coniochaeta sp. 2T2.1]
MAMREKEYNPNSSMQHAAMLQALDLLPSYPTTDRLTVIDYGCSQGANSIPALKRVLSSLPENASATLHFEDTPQNDFTTLAQTIDANLPALSTANGSSLTLYSSLLPTSFFRPVVAPGTVDLGLAWSCLTYLSHQPELSLDATATPADFAITRAKALASAGHKDLIQVLVLRGAEIKPGGHLVAAIGGQPPTPDSETGDTGVAPVTAAMMKFVVRGKANMQELSRFALWPASDPSLGEVRKVLEEPSVAELWEVEHLEAKLVVHPAWEGYRIALDEAGGDGDRVREARERYIRAVVGNLLAASGWFWVEKLKETRGRDWDGGEAWLRELEEEAVMEGVEKFGEMKVRLWYTYLKLKRRSG